MSDTTKWDIKRASNAQPDWRQAHRRGINPVAKPKTMPADAVAAYTQPLSAGTTGINIGWPAPYLHGGVPETKRWGDKATRRRRTADVINRDRPARSS